MSFKILFINGGSKKFGDDFRSACSKEKVECTSIRSRNTIVDIKAGEIALIAHNELLDVDSYAYAFIRVKGRFSHMLSVIVDVLKKRGIPFNDKTNGEHSLRCEKINQMVALTFEGLKIPNTIILGKYSYRENQKYLEKRISFPCVVKTVGSKGDFVWKISSKEELEQKLRATEQELFLIQEVIENSYDIRALFFEGECIGAIKRTSADGFLNNIAKGGTAELIELSSDEIRLCQKACEALELDFGGVDFVRTKSGPVFFEVNKGPQVYGFQDAGGVNVPEALVKIIKKNYSN